MASFAAFLLIATQLTTGSCEPFVSDQFECGLAQDDSRELAKICNEAGQVCICNGNRCAESDDRCPSKLRYSYPPDNDDDDESCVPLDREASHIFQPDAAHGFCPGEGPATRCGVIRGNVPCASNEVCICATNTCARQSTRCEEPETSVYEYSRTGECVEKAHANPDQVLFPSAGPTLAVCPSFDPPMPPCGVSIEGRPAVVCKDSICVCADALPRCAFKSDLCESSYAWQQGNECVEGPTKAEIEDESQRVDSNGFCPGYGPGGDEGGAGGGTSDIAGGAGAGGAAAGGVDSVAGAGGGT